MENSESREVLYELISCPNEIFVHVMYFLPLKDLGNFSLLNKRINSIVNSSYMQNYIKNLDWRSDVMKLVHSTIDEAENNEFNERYCLKRVHYLLTKGISSLEDFEVKDWDKYEIPSDLSATRSTRIKIEISRDVNIDDIHRQDNHRTCLFKCLSIRKNHLRKILLTLLVCCGVDTNSIDSDGTPPLHFCVDLERKYRNEECHINLCGSFHILLRFGSNYQILNSRGLNAFQYSFLHGCDSFVSLIGEYGGNYSFIYDTKLVQQRHKIYPSDKIFHNFKEEFNYFGFKDSEISPEFIKLRNCTKRYLQKKSSRLKKWEEMILKFGKKLKHHPKLKKRIGKGIPNEIRGKVWKILMNIEEIKKRNIGVFERLKNSEEEARNTNCMDVDINRTFRNHKLYINRYSRTSIHLFQVLKCFCLYDQSRFRAGYCYIAGQILMFVDDPEDAFWIFVTLLNHPKYNLKGYFDLGFPKLIRDFDIHDHFIEKKLPKLYFHFLRENCIASMYCTRWYMLWFLDILPFRMSIRIFDVIISEGGLSVFHFSIGLLRYFERRLLKMKFEQIIPFLLHLDEIDYDIDDIIKRCLDEKIVVTNELIEKVTIKRTRYNQRGRKKKDK